MKWRKPGKSFAISLALVGVLVLISHVAPTQVSAAPSEVWVSPDYTENTQGWGVTHFSSIQTAVDAAAQGGTVNVLTGTYEESITITKSVSLLGESAGTTIIDAQEQDNCVLIQNITDVTISGLTLKRDGAWLPVRRCTLGIEGSSGVTIQNNNILGTGISLGTSHDNLIKNNHFDSSCSIMLFDSWNNHVENNDIQAYSGHPITLMNNSCNNVFLGNTLIGIEPNAPCTGFRLVYSSNNLIANNTIQNFRAHVLLTGSNNCIVANNSISISRGSQSVNQCGIILYRANNNMIINNDVSSLVAAGIRLIGYSKGNTIKGNMITDVGLGGIELYYESDGNTLSDNDVSGCSFGIILDDASGNEIYTNNFANNEQNGFDDGSNTWVSNGTGNYWGDYEGTDSNNGGTSDMQYEIAPKGVDDSPLINKVEVTPAEIPRLEEITRVSPPMQETISTHEIWEERAIELSNPFQILEGASLTLRNVDLKVNFDGPAGLFIVEPGGSLEISQSRIIAYGQQINISKGAIFKVEESELYGLGHWDGGGGLYVECDGAIINNNVIQGGYAAICFLDSGYHQVTGNSIFNCGFGIISSGGYGNNLIENNDIFNIIGEGIFGGGLTNSIITGNTFRDIWGYPISLKPVGIGKGATGNTIYNNNFIECGAPFEESSDNVWYYMNTGNHWSDSRKSIPMLGSMPGIPVFGIHHMLFLVETARTFTQSCRQHLWSGPEK